VRVPTFSRMLWPGAIGGLALACALAPTESAVTAPPAIASVRLFDRGGDITDHIALGAGRTLRIEVRLYAADGDRILPADGDVVVRLTFDPPSYATATDVPDAPLLKDVTPTAAPGIEGGIYVTCEQVKLMVTIRRGPFESLIHPSS